MDKHEADYLSQFATERQKEYLKALAGASYRDAAKILGLNKNTIQEAIKRVKTKAAKSGYAPEHDMVKTCPDGYFVKGVSTLYTNGEDGTKVSAQWVKTQADQERQRELMRESLEAFMDEMPKAERVIANPITSDDLLNLYLLTDYHLGMLAWHEEGGEDWDLKIAEAMLIDWFRVAIESSPDAEVGYFCQLGDFLHWDGMEAVTPASGHVLDADGRFQKVVRVAIKLIRKIVEMLLNKHQHVVMLMADANHDPASEIWLREMFYNFYEHEPRVTVDRNADTYYSHKWGKTSLFFHHGHKRKVGDISQVFTAKFPELFGQTKFRYGHVGHLHHKDTKEDCLMVVEQHRTLAAQDAYASRGGWLSGRSAPVITYSKELGEVCRQTIAPEMIMRRMKEQRTE